MRNIKFRGKPNGTNDWVEGDLLHKQTDSDTVIIQNEKGVRYDCNPETIGQFTGILDSKGKEIFEGDIIESPDGHMHIISFNGEYGAFMATLKGEPDVGPFFLYPDWIKNFNKTVTGNIYDKPKKPKK